MASIEAQAAVFRHHIDVDVAPVEICDRFRLEHARLTAVRPTLAEYILEMPRGAQVIYPKDLGPILMLADIYPGARILESGVGSGALTMVLLRAIGPTGHVTGYELRDDFADRARRNVEGLPGPTPPLAIEDRRNQEGHDEAHLA